MAKYKRHEQATSNRKNIFWPRRYINWAGQFLDSRIGGNNQTPIGEILTYQDEVGLDHGWPDIQYFLKDVATRGYRKSRYLQLKSKYLREQTEEDIRSSLAKVFEAEAETTETKYNVHVVHAMDSLLKNVKQKKDERYTGSPLYKQVLNL